MPPAPPGSLSGQQTAPTTPDLAPEAAVGLLSLPPQLGDPSWHLLPQPGGVPRCHAISQRVLAAEGHQPEGQRGPSAKVPSVQIATGSRGAGGDAGHLGVPMGAGNTGDRVGHGDSRSLGVPGGCVPC